MSHPHPRTERDLHWLAENFSTGRIVRGIPERLECLAAWNPRAEDDLRQSPEGAHRVRRSGWGCSRWRRLRSDWAVLDAWMGGCGVRRSDKKRARRRPTQTTLMNGSVPPSTADMLLGPRCVERPRPPTEATLSGLHGAVMVVYDSSNAWSAPGAQPERSACPDLARVEAMRSMSRSTSVGRKCLSMAGVSREPMPANGPGKARRSATFIAYCSQDRCLLGGVPQPRQSARHLPMSGLGAPPRRAPVPASHPPPGAQRAP
jgi:hypothetical protein